MNSMCQFHLDAHDGSNYLEFCIGHARQSSKFENEGSLFVLDNAFWCLSIHPVFCKAVPGFDMFEDTVITESQWKDIFCLSQELDEESRVIIDTINNWTKEAFQHSGVFTVLGV